MAARGWTRSRHASATSAVLIQCRDSSALIGPTRTDWILKAWARDRRTGKADGGRSPPGRISDDDAMVAGDSTKVPPGRSEDLASRHPSRTWAWVRAVMVPTAITAWCLHPLVLPGFILQVDAVFGPRSPLSLEGVAAPLVLLSHLLGGALAGRVFVSGALFLCGFGPMVLLRQQTWLAQIPAALLGMLNPFVYDRLIEGQWGVAAALGILSCGLRFGRRSSVSPVGRGPPSALWQDGRRSSWTSTSSG